MSKLRDTNSVIERGTNSFPNSFEPILWNDFLNDYEKSLTLRELIFILEKWTIKLQNNEEIKGELNQAAVLLYRNVFKYLATENISQPIPEYPLFLKELVTEIPDEIKYQTTGIIIDASFFFSMFFLCKQLAGATGYKYFDSLTSTTINSYSINPDSDYLDEIFNSSDLNLMNDRLRVENPLLVDNQLIPENVFHIYNILYPILINGSFSDNSILRLILDPKQKIGNGWFDNNSAKKIVYDFFNDADASINFYKDKIIKNDDNIRLDFEKEKMLKCYSTEFFRLLQKKGISENIPKYHVSAIALGDGTKTKGFLGITNLGVILNTYDYSERSVSTRIKTSTSFIINRNSILHFNIYGMDLKPGTKLEAEKSKITISDASKPTEWKIEFNVNKLLYNGIRMVRNSNTLPPSYSTSPYDINNNNIFNFLDTLFFYNEKRIALFKRSTNDLFFYITNPIEISVSIDSYEGDEIFCLLSVSENQNAHDLFESDKFELTSSQINSLLDDKICDIIIDYLEQDYKISPILIGDFVGKVPDDPTANPEVLETDNSYKPTDDPSKETGEKVDNATLRHSSFEIGTIDINQKNIPIRSNFGTFPINSNTHKYRSSIFSIFFISSLIKRNRKC